MKTVYESDNLIYKILHSDSAGQVLEFYNRNREAFNPYEPEKPDIFYTLSYHETLLRLEYEQFLRHQGVRFFVYEKDTPGKIAGCVSFNNIIKGCFCQARIGYKTDFECQRRGIAKEAVTFSTNLMAQEEHIHRIEAYILSTNTASLRLAASCGFVNEGCAASFARMAGGWTDFERYVLIMPESH